MGGAASPAQPKKLAAETGFVLPILLVVLLLGGDGGPVGGALVVEVEEGLLDQAPAAAEDREHLAEEVERREAGGEPGVEVGAGAAGANWWHQEPADRHSEKNAADSSAMSHHGLVAAQQIPLGARSRFTYDAWHRPDPLKHSMQGMNYLFVRQ